MKENNNPSEVDKAFKMYERVFRTLKDSKAAESNRHHVGHPERIEHDLNEIEKAHLNLLQTNIFRHISDSLIETIKNSSDSSSRLSNHIFWLSVVGTVLTIAIAGAAIIQAIDIISEW